MTIKNPWKFQRDLYIGKKTTFDTIMHMLFVLFLVHLIDLRYYSEILNLERTVFFSSTGVISILLIFRKYYFYLFLIVLKLSDDTRLSKCLSFPLLIYFQPRRSGTSVSNNEGCASFNEVGRDLFDLEFPLLNISEEPSNCNKSPTSS